MFFNSVKEINRLLSKEMSNIYLKVTIEEKNWRSQNFDFLGLKTLSSCQFWGAPTHADITEFYKFLLQFKNKVWEQNHLWLFYYYLFERYYDALKSKSLYILLNKNINFNQNKTESKTENPTHCFREKNLVLQLIQESQIKSKTVMSWSSLKKKEGIFCTVYFVRGKFV